MNKHYITISLMLMDIDQHNCGIDIYPVCTLEQREIYRYLTISHIQKKNVIAPLEKNTQKLPFFATYYNWTLFRTTFRRSILCRSTLNRGFVYSYMINKLIKFDIIACPLV